MARSRTRVTAGLLSIVAACLLVASAASGQTGATTDERPKLGKHDRALIARAEAAGRENVTLLLATREGQTEAAANAIEGAGGQVEYRDNEVGYLRVDMPLDRVEAVEQIESIEAADVDEIIPLPDPRPEGIAPIPIPQPPPGPDTPNDNPYMPIRDIGASQFMAENPTWDGRQVTIGILDTGVDLEHPSLQRTTTGERKIVDWVTGTAPGTDPDPTWINMATQVTAVNFEFTVSGVTYRAPRRNGTFNFGVFNEANPLFGGEYSVAPTPGGDLNRDGDETDVFPILQAGNTVWVDTNQNRNFQDERAMQEYRRDFDVDFFGVDRPGTPERDRVPFVVQIEQVTIGGAERTYVNIGIVSGAHGSHVAGIAAGHSLFGGEMSGAAPGAKIVSVRACLFVAGCTAHALTEGMIYAVRRARVDVVNMSIGGLPALNDGNNARCELYNRLIERRGVQFFFSQGNNGPGVNTAGDPAVCEKVMAVGAYITRESYARNYGVDEPFAIPFEENLLYFTSLGPSEDGKLKPQIVASGSAISTIPLWQPGQPVPGTYALPPGYAMFNGTSMSAPQATGGAALLISAAKQTGLRQYEPAQLRQAIKSSARYITEGDRYQAYEQGNGLMNVPGAWELLRQRIEAVNIEAAVQVNTVLAGQLQPPFIGVGIHDREGVVAGVPYVRTYTLRRTTGSNQPITYNLSWTGNDGTFSTAGSVTLDRNRTVSLDVHINPTVGGHSAILNFDDPSNPGIEFQTLNTVLVPYEFTAENGYTVEIEGEVGRGQNLHYFFRVPANTTAFKVDFSGPSEEPGTGQARFLRWTPEGLPFDSNAVSSCYLPPQPPVNPCNPPPAPPEWGNDPSSRAAVNPMAGVWEVTVDARRTSDADFAPFRLTVTILGAEIEPSPDIIESATVGETIEREYTITNRYAAFTGRAVGTDLGSARLGRFTIAHLETQEYDTTIPAGTTRFRATIGNPSDRAADLDLFVFRCTPNCVLVGQSADGDSEETVTLNNPPAGLYRVEVDGFDVPAGSTQYDYIDVFYKTPPFGTIEVDDEVAPRPSGSSWTVPARIVVNEAPAEGRVLYGNIEVRTDANLVIGRSDVIVRNVGS